MGTKAFDGAFYNRFYREPGKRVREGGELRRLVTFLASYLKYHEIPVETALDLGCGLGHFGDELRRHYRSIEYEGVEYSEHLADEMGWAQGSIVDWDGDPADLVICQGVLQYLPTRDAGKAIRNLARLTENALYLEVLTQEDWDHNCDQDRTDGEVYLRPAAWYWKQLEGRFISLGGGLFVPTDNDVVMYELERPPY